MRLFFTTILGAAALAFGVLGLGTAAKAQTNLVVVELYTSQGCSSCPPADALLTKLASRKDVLALALHVDYWDYIGWKDTFGDPAHTVRQRAYARAAGTRTIYTPQMIVGGVGHVVGNQPMEVLDEIGVQFARETPVTVSLERVGTKIKISANSQSNRVTPMTLQLVRYRASEATKITRGENAGRTIDYTNIVTEWRQIKQWDGTDPLNMSLTIKGDSPVAVIIQGIDAGPIMAAARLQ